MKKYEEDYEGTSTEIDMIIKEQNYQDHVKWMKETKSKPQVFDQSKLVKTNSANSTPKLQNTPTTSSNNVKPVVQNGQVPNKQSTQKVEIVQPKVEGKKLWLND